MVIQLGRSSPSKRKDVRFSILNLESCQSASDKLIGLWNVAVAMINWLIVVGQNLESALGVLWAWRAVTA